MSDDTTRLLTYNGRTAEALTELLEEVSNNHSTSLDLHYLLSETAHQSGQFQPFRGYALLNHQQHVIDVQVGTEHWQALTITDMLYPGILYCRSARVKAGRCGTCSVGWAVSGTAWPRT